MPRCLEGYRKLPKMLKIKIMDQELIEEDAQCPECLSTHRPTKS